MTDLKFALRQLWKDPGFTAVAVVTLALGIGANTAIFSFVHSILLRPLPYQGPERLVMVFENNRANGWEKMAAGAPALREWRERSSVFEGLMGSYLAGFIHVGTGEPENLPGALVSANCFSLLGVQPYLGRDFLPEEEAFGNHRVALLSYELWQRRFGGDADVVGRDVTLNAQTYQVIGVMPRRTMFPSDDPQLWAPLAFSPSQLAQRHAHNYLVYGRLKEGVALSQAQAEMDGVAAAMAEADPQNQDWGVEVDSLHETMVGDSRRVLWILLGAVGFVLLIVCANLANLLLARAASRTRDFAIRAALGGSRRAIARQLLAESLTLAALGGAAGSLVAWLGTRVLLRVGPTDLPRLGEGIALNAASLGFMVLATVLTGLLIGLLPALRASSPSLIRYLKDGARSGLGRRRKSVRSALVVGQVAVSLTLLAGAGLMVRSYASLVSQDMGYDPEHVIAYGLTLPQSKYRNQSECQRFFDRLLAGVRAAPGVESAAVILAPPMSGFSTALSANVVGAPDPAAGHAVSAGYSQISPDYFKTLRIPLAQGRDFTEQDGAKASPVVIVDETFVKNFGLGADALGRRVSVGDGTDGAEIVGIVKDIKYVDMAAAPRGELYRPYTQVCWGSQSLTVRTRRHPADMARVVRSVLDGIDKDQPLNEGRALTQLLSSSVASQRLAMRLLGGFALAALLLAALGLYGVLAASVSQRTRELGVRMALGAQRRTVLSLVVAQGMRLTLAGAAVGVVAALSLTRVMRKLLYGVEPTDPLTFIVVPLLLGLVALLACWIPARRAVGVDPATALRVD